MKVVQYVVKTAGPLSSDSLRPEHGAGGFVKHIERAGLLAAAIAATMVLAAGCASTGTGFGARLISPVPNHQQATHSENDSWYQTPRSPAFERMFSWALPRGELGGLPGEFYQFAKSIRSELSAVSVRPLKEAA